MEAQETRFSITSFFMVGNSSRSKDKGQATRHGGRGAALPFFMTARPAVISDPDRTADKLPETSPDHLPETSPDHLPETSPDHLPETSPEKGAAVAAAALIPRITKPITPERLAEIDKANFLAVAFARNEPLSQADFDFLGLYLLKSIKAAILSACGWHWHEGKELLDDLVYDAFIKVMKYLQTFTGEKGRLGSLVSVIAIHHFYNAMKSRRREQADALDHFNYLCSVNPDYRASIAENWIINTED